MGSFYSLHLCLLFVTYSLARITGNYYQPKRSNEFPDKVRPILHQNSISKFHGLDTVVPFHIVVPNKQKFSFEICFDESDACKDNQQELILCYRVHNACSVPKGTVCNDMYGIAFMRGNPSNTTEDTVFPLEAAGYDISRQKCNEYMIEPGPNLGGSLKIAQKHEFFNMNMNVCELLLLDTVKNEQQLEIALMASTQCRASINFTDSFIVFPGDGDFTTTEEPSTMETITPPEILKPLEGVANSSISKKWWIFVLVGVALVIIVIVCIVGLKWRAISNLIRRPNRRRVRVTALPASSAGVQQTSDDIKLTENSKGAADTENKTNPEVPKDPQKTTPEIVVVKAPSADGKKDNKPKESSSVIPSTVVKANQTEGSADKNGTGGDEAVPQVQVKKVIPLTKSCYQRSLRAVTARPIEPPLPLNKTQSFSENEMTADELEYLAFCTPDPGKRFRIFRAAVKTAERVAEIHGYFLNARDPTVPEEEDVWVRVGADNLIRTCIELHGEPLPAIGDSHNDHMEYVATHSLREIYQVALYVELDDATRMYFLTAVVDRFRDLLKKFTMDELQKCKHPMQLLMHIYKEHPEIFDAKVSRNFPLK